MMIPVAPVALLMPENVSVVGKSLIPLVDSNRIPTAGTLNLSDSVPCNCDKQRYYLDLTKSRGRIGSIASQQCLYQLSILCK